MTDSEEDLALHTLLTVRAEIAPDLEEETLCQCYAIQKKHQFNNDRTQSSSAMERLIDLKIESLAGESNR